MDKRFRRVESSRRKFPKRASDPIRSFDATGRNKPISFKQFRSSRSIRRPARIKPSIGCFEIVDVADYGRDRTPMKIRAFVRVR
ncbi:MAG: hypothetical protein MZU97_05065 [Bacillus subtilis]|nr:hypothetical protein [Bacillus subtilis]